MIVCPNCNHQNPEGASQCEACYTPLPQTTSCPNCGAMVQTDATFCGQCGFNLQAEAVELTFSELEEVELTKSETETALGEYDPFSGDDFDLEVPEETTTSFADHTSPWDEPDTEVAPSAVPDTEESKEMAIDIPPSEPVTNSTSTESSPDIVSETASVVEFSQEIEPASSTAELEEETEPASSTANTSKKTESTNASSVTPSFSSATQIQIQTGKLFHVQTETQIEIPHNLSVIHIGKPNNQIPPDIDVSGFPNSEIVSRVHADIRVEGDLYYIEDVGSSNGTYINHTPLLTGNRHRLRSGDRIALGKGDLVTFIFQLS